MTQITELSEGEQYIDARGRGRDGAQVKVVDVGVEYIEIETHRFSGDTRELVDKGVAQAEFRPA
jgi:hypothetical protein